MKKNAIISALATLSVYQLDIWVERPAMLVVGLMFFFLLITNVTEVCLRDKRHEKSLH